MVLLLTLFIPLAGALFVFSCRQPHIVVRAALTTGALELTAIGVTVYSIHSRGVLNAGRYLRADGLTSFFLINLGLISALSQKQADYIGVPVEGPYKAENYRY